MAILLILVFAAWAIFWMWAAAQLAMNKGLNAERWGMAASILGPIAILAVLIVPAAEE